jgi:tRNA A-37 threonylcarbamoyl transferase component Bud32
MSQAIRAADQAGGLDPSTGITEIVARRPANGPLRRRCPVALVAGTGQALTQEMGCLLRRRLLMAALITGAGLTIFFFRHLFWPERYFSTPLNDVFLGSAAALQLGMAGLLASRLPLSVCRLRLVEVVLFGALGLFFAWLQVSLDWHRRVLEWAVPAHFEHVQRLANAQNTLRWFALIVTYGTFVPNTWRRCAVIVAIMALTPLALMVAAPLVLGCTHLMDCLGGSLMDTTIVLGIASAIAIFGSYKISSLQREAYEARQLGQYRLKQRLGSGGMGEVYLGEHLLLRRRCAIKLIRPDQAGDPTTLERFAREVQAMARLTHWNTVEVYDYGHADDGTFYYVMEYLPGLSLQDLVTRHGPLPPERAVHFLRQVCAALREAHTIGLIHRDIKPSNVIASERGGVPDVAKLLDFGLVQCMNVAQADVRLTVQGAILGSPPFMSPEQALGKDDVDARTDIYSVGALGYFLLTGQPPFVRETAMQILMAHVYEQITPPSQLRPDIPADLEAVILRCLEKDPSKRFPDAEALDEGLSRCECAGRWTREDAASWWRSQELREGPPSSDGAPQDDYAGIAQSPVLAGRSPG